MEQAGSAEIDAAVAALCQRARFDMVDDVRLQVAIGTWGWMTEHREKLDFDTIKQSPTGARASLAELLTDDEQATVVHDILVAKKKELTAAEITRIPATAPETRRRTPPPRRPGSRARRSPRTRRPPRSGRPSATA